jgi:hypothetical protein
MELEMQQLPHIRDPLSSPSPFYILVETHGSNEAHDTEVLFSSPPSPPPPVG